MRINFLFLRLSHLLLKSDSDPEQLVPSTSLRYGKRDTVMAAVRASYSIMTGAVSLVSRADSGTALQIGRRVWLAAGVDARQ